MNYSPGFGPGESGFVFLVPLLFIEVPSLQEVQVEFFKVQDGVQDVACCYSRYDADIGQQTEHRSLPASVVVNCLSSVAHLMPVCLKNQ